jgi:nucleoside phosphorylase
MRTFRKYELGLAILCGIGAGVPGEVEKYSVVISNGVVDYESQRLTEGGSEYRLDPIDIDEYHKRRLGHLSSIQQRWHTDYIRLAEEKLIDPADFNISVLANSTIKVGLIASGGKLLADGKTISTLRENIPIKKGVIAAEMEGAGFAAVCKELKKDWLIFRGISDFGADDKNDKLNKKYQKIAAAAAIKATCYYLSALYKKPSERDLEF